MKSLQLTNQYKKFICESNIPLFEDCLETINNRVVLHSLSLDNLEKLNNLKLTNKYICTFSKWTNNSIFLNGVEAKSNEYQSIAILEGCSLFEANEDLWTFYTSDGMRWIEVSNMLSYTDDLMLIMTAIMVDITEFLFETFGLDYNRKIMKLKKSEFSSFLNNYKMKINSLFKKYNNNFKELLDNEVFGYNEIILNNFKIKEIVTTQENLYDYCYINCLDYNELSNDMTLVESEVDYEDYIKGMYYEELNL